MSDLFRQSVNGHQDQPPSHMRPPPAPITNPPTSELSDDHSSSDSSADSSASVNTLRPSSRSQPLDPSTHWSSYFAQELYLDNELDDRDEANTPHGEPHRQRQKQRHHARYHVYLTPPRDPRKGPLLICHHGAGASGLSFAAFAKNLREKVPEAGLLSLEARGHGSEIVASSSTPSTEDGGDEKDATRTEEQPPDFSLETLTSDAASMIHLTKQRMHWPSLPPSILIGHSLGGAVLTNLATSPVHRTKALGGNLSSSLVGLAVLDVVEGSALEALGHMQTYLSSRPTGFGSVEEAVQWHVRSRTIRNAESARVSVPSLLVSSSDTTPAGKTAAAGGRGGIGGKLTWRTPLSSTAPFWTAWFEGLSAKFLRAPAAKLLILAGTDRLDRDLLIGQMQGKFQLTVLPEAGHYVHEDVPERVAEVVAEFWRRNDRGSLVLPMKVSEMIAMGKKV